MITASEKANELINMYYNCNAKSQLEAIKQATEVMVNAVCHKIDDLSNQVINHKDYDIHGLIIPMIKELVWKRDVLSELKTKEDAINFK